MTEATFEPIKITGCDEKRVRRSTRKKGVYIFPFTLSAKPPSEWADAFEDIWRSHRKTSTKPKPDAYFRKNELVIECLLTDLKVHFAVFSSDVASANEAHLAQLRIKAEKDEKKKRKREEEKLAEREAIRQALEGLDFSEAAASDEAKSASGD